jgi:hypothetical protein
MRANFLARSLWYDELSQEEARALGLPQSRKLRGGRQGCVTQFGMTRRRCPCRVALALAALHCTEQPGSSYVAEPPAPVVLRLYDAGFTTDECYAEQLPLDIPERAECSGVKFPCESSSCSALSAGIVRWVGEQCGELPRAGFVVGVSEGCITTTHYVPEDSCLRAALLGTRWSCGPENGLANVRAYPEP